MAPNAYVDENNHRTWNERMLFYFTQIEVAYLFFTNPTFVESARIAKVDYAKTEFINGSKQFDDNDNVTQIPIEITKRVI